jgi:hypothetical protein
MKTYGGVKVELHAFFTLALDGVSGQLHAAAALSLGIHWMGGWLGLIPDLDTLAKREKSLFCP